MFNTRNDLGKSICLIQHFVIVNSIRPSGNLGP